ncbi:response regulator receiver domain protein (CheY-like) [Indibacter alkaliphilus LW1]|uniref:histidine kinase n=1 Tax=Indibacter alkaliphilus (strain CCUG 57479 / KCTC 22604 / LW1) TaxID=1189612 RepID=S2DHL1_INDAL|nr:ATP-binding protein [Indibacter alkaliphilus]EOZ96610.1 response regulator receiver domain protein (CheY-like) [Indibacter alkaliphilus LW1]
MQKILNKVSAARKIYETYWESYQNGDLETFASTLDDTFEMIGTSETEVCHSKTEGIEFLKAQLHEVVGKVEMRNRQIDVIPVDNLMLVNEQCDIYVFVGMDKSADRGYLSAGRQDWNFYSKIRISTFLSETGSGWKVIQQHGSLPDMRVQEGETMALEKISKENLELRDAIKRRTIELEQKNRELEIEGALEKVRSRSLAMHSSDELTEVVTVFFEKLSDLSIPVSAVGISINIEGSKDLDNYTCGKVESGIAINNYRLPYFDHRIANDFFEAREKQLDFFVGNYSKQEKDSFYEYVIEHTELKNELTEEIKQFIFQSLFYSISVVSTKHTMITLNDFEGKSLADGEIDILKRFAKVFDQAYIRFLDLQKAEAQAREAQIEAALERVRAQTMAMHSSEDVGKCVVKMFSELTALGVDEGTRFGIGILNHDNENNQLWTARKTGEEVNMHIGNIDMAWHPMLKRARQAWLEQVPFHKYVLEGEDLLNYYQMLNNAPDYKIQIPIEKLPKKEIQHCFIFEHGFFYAFTPREFQPELIHITKRFSALFEQTYRRYLDLVRAEGQAREAEIELALERVRARTMAMQHSDELTEASEVLDRQVRELGIETWGCAFHIYADDPEGDYEWFSSREGSLPFYKTPRENFFLKFYEKGKAGETFHVEEFLGEDCKVHYDYLMTIPVMGDALREIVASGASLPESQYDHIAFFKHGFLLFITYKQVPQSHAIFQRFAKVFEQTYTRFLDLQKAEAQAREAQIEASLERIRAKAMSMHHSDELDEVLAVLCEQFDTLGIFPMSTHMTVLDIAKNKFTFRETGKFGNRSFGEQTVALDAMDTWKDMVESWKSAEPYSINRLHFPKDTLAQVWEVFHESFASMPEGSKITPDDYPDGIYHTAGKHPFGYIGMNQVRPATEKEEQIVIKFANEFGRAYQRFLDLQKAEAQAREAQIEAALEKVRSRSLAMHKSEELNEVVSVLFEKLKELQIPFTAIGIATNIEGSKDLNAYVCGQNEAGLVITNYRLHHFDNPVPKDLYGAIEEQLDYFVGHYSKEEKDAFYKYVIEHTAEFRHLPEDIKRMIFDSTNYTISMVAVKNAVFNVNDFEGKVLAENEIDIIKRFARVFDQAYTRFLDLQKAEIQAREAQIEAGLERVRSRAMAMHSSQELREVAMELRKQMGLLGQKDLEVCAIHLYGDDKDSFESWSAMKSPDSETEIVQTQANFPKKGIRIVDELMQHYSSGTMDYILVNDGEKIAEWFKVMENNAPELHASIMHAIGNASVNKLEANWSVADFSGGALVMVTYGEPDASSRNLLRRSANVFEQAYIRFLDLQKAEDQAREAQIQLALERVRARTMAMQKSEELADAAFVLFEQLRALGGNLWGTGFGLCQENVEKDEFWFANENGVFPPVAIPNTTDLAHKQMYQGWLKKTDFLSIEKSRAALKEHYDYMLSLPDVRTFFQKIIDQGLSFPEKQQWNAAYFSKGYLLIITLEPYPEPEIFKRFAKVFEQTYTRFLDLQRAEAQAKEAQIEAALERVRSRSLAMHHSTELSAVVDTLLREFTSLEFTLTFCIINLIDEQDMSNTVWAANPETGKDPESYYMKFEDYPFHHAMWDAWKAQKKRFVYTIAGEEKKTYDEYLYNDTEFRRFPKNVQKANKSLERYVAGFTFFKYSGLQTVSVNPISEDELEILERFGRVFEQAYTRFLDLQKAEAQAREAEIQLALERVRAKTMAMKTQSDLLGIIELFGEQLNAVGIRFDNVTFIEGPITKKRDWDLWSYAPEAENTTDKILIPYIETPYFTKTAKAVKEYQKTGQPIQVKTFTKKEKNEFPDHYWKHAPVVSDEFVNYVNATPGSIIVDAFLEEITVSMVKWNTEPYTVEELEIYERFAKEFRQTYIRFLDIKKAEAQVREAKIETSLEKVRSRTMGMQNSDELAEVANVLFAEMNDLVHNLWTCGFVLCEKGREEDEWWLSLEDGFSRGFFLPNVNDYAHATLYKGWLEGDSFRTVQLDGDKLQEHYDWLMEIPVAKNIFDDMEAAGMQRPEWQKLHAAYFSKGYLVIITREPCPEEEIFKRFAKVFDQTYTRFLDLQKAEAQARESKIETALEKVRSRTMGMQSSEELPEVANLLFTEVRSLGIPAWSCGYNILEEDKKTATAWMSSEGIMQTPFQLRLFGEASFDEMGEFIPSDHTMFVQELGGKALEDHYAYMKTFPDLQSTFKNIEEQGLSLPTYQINHLCKFGHGFLLFITYEPVPDAHGLFKRFTSVFDQTYTRFLDLKKAEAQTREAQIENALEKVRSRSLAMQSPDELIEVAQLLRDEMGALGVEELETSSIYIHDESSGLTQCWFTIKNPDNPDKAITDQMDIDLQGTWVGRKMDEFYQSKAKQTSILMQGEERIEWIRYCEEKSDLFGSSNFYGETIPDRTYHLYKFSNGYIGAAAPGEISTESWELLKRATAVFSFAYTRFRDLQMAQASARTAMRQASLDRVRADISSMRNADDLDRITPLFFHELTTLGIPFIRCGVFIVHEKERNVEIYLSTSEGKSLAAMNLPFEANEMTARSVEAWKREQVYIQHWDKADFINWSKSLQEQGHVKDLKTYQGTDAAPESLHLHFVPFAQGLLYVGSPRTLDEEQIDLVKALARSFAIAYARYEDFVKLEQAKAEVESAMSELKATQSQLVQQEKLASLGQLTAGIAHEIKNPLNFVNNFSEVSMEMIEEIQDSRLKTQDTRHKTEADEIEDEILEDIKANLKKIHEHGSRANGIVTSMLQHSRGGSGKMEPTDLNALIKEYVNLSFHGMRAGKNPIDVDIELDLDPELGNVPLIKEDFTRVVINLCNNAFDAMRGKKYEVQSTKYNDGEIVDGNYIPKLRVTTMLEMSRVRISLEDNGPGIPDDIKDKILQPFFTTKKGTEGTGLGLSITHDIVKAHGGQLEIKSSPGEGSTFIIQLPK